MTNTANDIPIAMNLTPREADRLRYTLATTAVEQVSETLDAAAVLTGAAFDAATLGGLSLAEARVAIHAWLDIAIAETGRTKATPPDQTVPVPPPGPAADVAFRTTRTAQAMPDGKAPPLVPPRALTAQAWCALIDQTLGDIDAPRFAAKALLDCLTESGIATVTDHANGYTCLGLAGVQSMATTTNPQAMLRQWQTAARDRL